VNARQKRAARLADLAKDRVDASRARVAEARRAAADGKAEVEGRESAWSTAAALPLPPLAGIDDLERQSAHLQTLRLHADVARRRLFELEQAEAAAELLLVEAMKHRRKLELWSERIAAQELETNLRAESKVADELAARIVRNRP
jgi:hypothetical protein